MNVTNYLETYRIRRNWSGRGTGQAIGHGMSLVGREDIVSEKESCQGESG